VGGLLQRNNISHQPRLTKTISHYQRMTTSAVRDAEGSLANCNPQWVEKRHEMAELLTRNFILEEKFLSQ